ncbi:TOMM precursor leader peptide-binding protein [Pseudalkalibacillus salsuginis]|uniref:TOMM precursor leader peptide-binding protein n=1 Tax=Pseudalkalibacillus salsuginis TaxID=2910972 RepID=UPI001F214CE4|nr:TOMM precursor leader peptide-binding protein [Pseudalkalibacillus salsuginis]MCF6409846.1 TOMM precursor leader peptide-binding protein [Pseudalkalibacillus salsuginis]
MRDIVLVVGYGMLVDKVCERLDIDFKVIRRASIEEDIPEMTELVLVLHDTWVPSVHQQAENVFRHLRIPWLRGFLSFGEGVIGPLVQPDKEGCSYCADTRLLVAGRETPEMWGLREQRMAHEDSLSPDPWSSNTGLLQLAYLIAGEAKKALEGDDPQSADHIYLMNMKTLEGSWRFILPEAVCPVCSNLPEDAEQSARITLKPSPKVSPGSFRTRSMDDLEKVLEHDYLNTRTGITNHKMYDSVTVFADVIVNLPLFSRSEGTGGRTYSYKLSEMTGILEALERSCGIGARGKRTVVFDSYRHLGHHALDPLEVGVHEDEHYDKPDFPYQKFNPDRKMNWVWGHSFLQDRQILVPERLAYYSLGCGDGFVYETSNGCALGGSLEEAVFHGIMEVIERDAFLMTWYAQLNLPRLDPYSADDKELHLMIGRMKEIGGYDFHLYNATMEHGIPSVWALVKNRKQKGMNLLCAAGAHLDPIRAVKSAVYELAGMVMSLEDKFESHKSNYVKLYQDSSQVNTMDDHGMLYGLKEAEGRLQFLLDEDRQVQSFAEAFHWETHHRDLTEDLKKVLDAFKNLGLDVIVVDQTTAEIRRNGLHCVKVLIPGMLPMTFGHDLTRVKGLKRVLTVPAELGYYDRPLTYDQLNPHPHPFP